MGFFYYTAVYLQVNLEEYSYLYNIESSHSEYGLAHLLFKSSFMRFSKILQYSSYRAYSYFYQGYLYAFYSLVAIVKQILSSIICTIIASIQESYRKLHLCHMLNIMAVFLPPSENLYNLFLFISFNAYAFYFFLFLGLAGTTSINSKIVNFLFLLLILKGNASNILLLHVIYALWLLDR